MVFEMKRDAGEEYAPVKFPNNVVRKMALTVMNLNSKWKVARLSQNHMQVTQ